MIIDKLYEIQRCLVKDLPQVGTNERTALDHLDSLIDELE